MEQEFRDVWARLDISFDDFIRTTEPRHKAGVQRAGAAHRTTAATSTRACTRAGTASSCEAFKQEKDLVDGHVSAPPDDSPSGSRRRTTSSGCRSTATALLEHFAAHPDVRRSPRRRRNEILRLLEGGLEDISVSRAGQSWGIPLPFDPTSVVYVWFDALINYVVGRRLRHATTALFDAVVAGRPARHRQGHHAVPLRRSGRRC